MVRALLFYCACLLAAGHAGGEEPDWLNAGPVYDDFKLTLASGHRTEVAGPLFYNQELEAQKTWAFCPLMSLERDPATESEEFDFLYPVLTYNRYGGEYRWQLFQLLSFAGGKDPNDSTRDRFTLFPIYFQQRGSDPSQNYTAVFPFYGHLTKRLLRDEIYVVMFPIYGQSRKKDVVTDNYVYPFFHLRHGDGLYGWQFWPILGHEHKEVTSQTNGFGDVSIIGGHDKWFALFPFFFTGQSGIGTENPGRQNAVWPLYVIDRSTLRDQTTVVWPFFSHVTERERKYREWQTPWPLVVFARGEGKYANRIWPLFSHVTTPIGESDFGLWPVYKYNRIHSNPLDRERTRILLFLYSDVNEKNTDSGTALHRVDFWPFFTHRRDFNGNSRLQIMALLEPIFPNNRKIERDYSPLWSFWRAENNVKTGAKSQSLLWNLYRRDTTPDTKKCSVFFGLFQYQSGPSGKHVRLFYIPLGKAKAAKKSGLQ